MAARVCYYVSRRLAKLKFSRFAFILYAAKAVQTRSAIPSLIAGYGCLLCVLLVEKPLLHLKKPMHKQRMKQANQKGACGKTQAR